MTVMEGFENHIYKCQFCKYEGKGWTQHGQKCPRCGKKYDWLLAQDDDE